MNEQLQNAVAEILERTINGIDSSVAFMQAELPDVISQLLMWYGVKSALLTVIGVALLFILIALDIKALKLIKGDEFNGADDVLLLWGLIGTMFRLITYPFVFMLMSFDWLQIWIAPKIWLMEYAASIVK